MSVINLTALMTDINNWPGRRVPIEGKSSVCVIFMKNRKMNLIIIIRPISLVKILAYRIGPYCKHIMHACVHTHTPAHHHRHSGCRCSMR